VYRMYEPEQMVSQSGIDYSQSFEAIFRYEDVELGSWFLESKAAVRMLVAKRVHKRSGVLPRLVGVLRYGLGFVDGIRRCEIEAIGDGEWVRWSAAGFHRNCSVNSGGHEAQTAKTGGARSGGFL
jgi:hypothetical protein